MHVKQSLVFQTLGRLKSKVFFFPAKSSRCAD